MKKLRKNGFVLILVIMVVGLIGVVMFVLTEDANTMLFQSNTAYLEAVERNLVTSGLAWAKHNLIGDKEQIFHKTIGLDVTDLNIRDANLSIVIGPGRDKEIEVEVSASCSRGRRTLRHHDRYKIRVSHKSRSNKTQI
ncbi:MAG: hypothetical protein ACE5NM_01910 [Sedimentisphaerales bacterium]